MTSSSGESEEEVYDAGYTGKRRPERKCKRERANPFFLSDGEMASIIEEFLIPEEEFRDFTSEICRVLQLPTSTERKSQWSVLQENSFPTCRPFMKKFRVHISNMVEFGAQRNESLLGGQIRRSLQSAKPLMDNGEGLKGHWGDILTTTINGRQWVIKVIDIARSQERRHQRGDIKTEDPVSEIDCHRHLVSLNNVYFPHLLDCVVDQTSAYYFIEQGEDLFTLCGRWHKSNSIENIENLEDIALNLFSDFLNAVKVMHESGLTHSDIKLENMIFFETPKGQCGKLIDFGTCRKHAEVGEYCITDREYSGTLTNISPERYFHNNKEGARKYHIDIQSENSFDAAKDDIWGWAVSLLSLFANGPIWEFPVHIREVRGASKRDEDQMFSITLATGGLYLPQGDDFAAKWFRRKRVQSFPLELAQLLKLTRICASKDKVFFSDELMDLFISVFVPENQRPSISTILHHPWFRKGHEV